MKENFPNLAKEIEVQEAQSVPNKLYPKRNTLRHIIKLPRIKYRERILKEARGKETVTYKGLPIRLWADFSKETLQARRGWKEVFKVMKGKDLHPWLLYPAKLSFRMEGQIKCFPDKVKLKEFVITKPLLYEMLKELIQEKEEDKKLWTVKWQQTHNSQQPNLKTQKQTKQTTRRGTESQKWRSHGGLSVGKGRGEWGKRHME